MAGILLQVLSDSELHQIREASWTVLEETGVRVHHAGAREALARAGCRLDPESQRVRFSESAVRQALAQAPQECVLHGRDPARVVRLGGGEGLLMSSPGQRAWLDGETGERRQPTLEDARAAIRLGEALPHIAIVGALAEPPSDDPARGAAELAGELINGTTKPSCLFAHSVEAARRVLAIYAAAAGGEQALRERPMTLGFLDPISPLQLPDEGMEVARAFARAGQPVVVASMAMSTGTAPATLAGTLALVHAEVLAGLTALQVLAPGTPVIYGGIPHVLDPRTSHCSFGSPEQGLMAAALSQLARAIGLPVYLNTGLTDALTLDAQAGFEKAASQTLGLLGGADLLGHAGICGADQAGSLEWLVADDAMMGHLRRIRRGFDVNPETLAAGVIRSVGPGGNFLAEPHTLQHFRRELWPPGPIWTRGTWEAWVQRGRPALGDRARERVRQLLAETPPLPPWAEDVARAVEETARRAQSGTGESASPLPCHCDRGAPERSLNPVN